MAIFFFIFNKNVITQTYKKKDILIGSKNNIGKLNKELGLRSVLSNWKIQGIFFYPKLYSSKTYIFDPYIFSMGLFKYLKSKEFLRTIIFMVVVVIILFYGLSKWMHYYTKHDQRIEVPNLEKLSTEEAQKVLSDANLTFYVLDSASFNPKFPPKSVMSQNPSAGDFVKEQRKIYLTLNPSSYRKIAVPDVIGLTKRQVVIQLKSTGFKIGKELYIRDLGLDVVRSLEVNRRKIKTGDKLPKNTSIDLILGDGLQKRDSLNKKVYK